MYQGLVFQIEEMVDTLSHLPVTTETGLARQSLKAALFWLTREKPPEPKSQA